MKRKRPVHEVEELEEPSLVKKRKSRSKRIIVETEVETDGKQNEEFEVPVEKDIKTARNSRKRGKNDDFILSKPSLQPGPSSSAKKKRKPKNDINQNGDISEETGILKNFDNSSNINKIRKKNGLQRRETSESPSDFQPLGQLFRKIDALKNKNVKSDAIKSKSKEINVKKEAPVLSPVPSKKKRSKKGAAVLEPQAIDNENTEQTTVQNIIITEAGSTGLDPKPVEKVLRRKKKHLQEVSQYVEPTNEEASNTHIAPKRPKKKVRIDETESLKVKKELAESEVHFSVRELPAKIIKSKLNKNMTEEVKVSPLTVQALKKDKKTVKNVEMNKIKDEPGVEVVEIKIEDVNNDNDEDDIENEGKHGTNDSEDSDLEVYYINKNAENEAKKKDKLPPKKHSILMPKEDQLSLVQRIQDVIPEGDSKSYKFRLQKLEWDKVAFRNYSLEDCQSVWAQLLKKVRHYRLLAELTHDIKTVIERNDLQVTKPKGNKNANKKHPDMPKRPLTSYFLYYIRKRDEIAKERPELDTLELNKYISEKYQNLPLEKKQKYEHLAAKNREDYRKQMEQFYEKHPEMRKVIIKKRKVKKEKPPNRPDNPYRLFMQSELSREEIAEEDKGEFKEVCREKWRQMSDAKKLGWINLGEEGLQKYEEELKEYMAIHPEYTFKPPPKPFLSRDEMNLKDRLAGKPKKPPGTAYGLFISLTVQGNEMVNIPPKERWIYTSAKWKAMSEAERDQYKQLVQQVHEQYEIDFKVYLETLPEDKRQEEILRNMPKKRKKAAHDKPSTSGKAKASTSKSQPPRRKSSTSDSSTKREIQNPIPPPRSAFKYFADKYQGENTKEAWKNLDSVEKEKYEKDLSVLKDKYIKEFEIFLKGLSKGELAAFCANRTSRVEYSSSDESDVESEHGDNEDSSDDSSESSESDNESEEN